MAAILSSENFYINGSMWEGILGLGYTRLSKVNDSSKILQHITQVEVVLGTKGVFFSPKELLKTK